MSARRPSTRSLRRLSTPAAGFAHSTRQKRYPARPATASESTARKTVAMPPGRRSGRGADRRSGCRSAAWPSWVSAMDSGCASSLKSGSPACHVAPPGDVGAKGQRGDGGYRGDRRWRARSRTDVNVRQAHSAPGLRHPRGGHDQRHLRASSRSKPQVSGDPQSAAAAGDDRVNAGFRGQWVAYRGASVEMPWGHDRPAGTQQLRQRIATAGAGGEQHGGGRVGGEESREALGGGMRRDRSSDAVFRERRLGPGARSQAPASRANRPRWRIARRVRRGKS